jgi:hypothetical protein
MSRSQRTLLIVLVIALLGVLAISALHDDDEATPPAATASAGPEIVTAAQLADFAATSGKAVYWIGPRSGAAYELTASPGSPIYVRYLRDGAEAGDPRPDFVTVATYPGGDGAAELRQTAAEGPEAKLRRGPGGALVLTDPATPDSAYLAFPGTGGQVELFSPIPGHAWRLAAKGEVLRVR